MSLHDADARPIARGSLGKPVQFAYKGQIVDNSDGVVLDHTLQQGNRRCCVGRFLAGWSADLTACQIVTASSSKAVRSW